MLSTRRQRKFRTILKQLRQQIDSRFAINSKLQAVLSKHFELNLRSKNLLDNAKNGSLGTYWLPGFKHPPKQVGTEAQHA
ncbi:hypothetical protein Krac_6866 [Ktedonobacter racemifer DSM 44963]|uniref:Uncharacterized protein n=1 Tax=Ktedonobacter racemifer DSM 44963 TaxID=485913 RepID=D6TPM5_KTERA|nr:hypothetical protein Krac_6866 [Ktedonobacter racemifer DSM 44963]